MPEPSPSKSTPAGTPSATPQLTGSVEQYQRFLPAAQALEPHDIQILRGNITTVVRNAARGVTAVLAWRDDLEKMPNVSIAEIEALAWRDQLRQVGGALATSLHARVSRAPQSERRRLTPASGA